MPTDTSTLLHVDHVRVAFPELTAVADASFTLRGGDLLGLVGPNGAGKTTLLRAICGLQSIHGGQVRVMDEPIAPGADVLAKVGFTPDNPPAYDELTVAQYLRFIGKGYQLDDADITARIGVWLDKVWLSEKRDQRIKALSRGMKQRLGIARTLLPDPMVILLDEPAAGLDPAGRVQFRRLLCDLRDQGKALIVSSHILADMGEYCTHIGILSGGSMVRWGTVKEFAAAEDQTRAPYQLALWREDAGFQKQLAGMEGVSNARMDGLHVTFEFDAHPQAAAKLLAELVGKGLPIASFAPQAVDLEQAYLRTGVAQVD